MSSLHDFKPTAADEPNHLATLADSVVLATESKSDFHQLLQDYLDRFQPADAVEAGWVHDMVAAQWQLIRCQSILTETLEPGAEGSIASAFTSNSKTLSLLLRLISSHRRAFEQSFKILRSLQASRAPCKPAPNPNSEHPKSTPTEPATPQQAEENTSREAENTGFKNEPNPNIEHLVPCACGRLVADPALRSWHVCPCGRVHKPACSG